VGEGEKAPKGVQGAVAGTESSAVGADRGMVVGAERKMATVGTGDKMMAGQRA